MYKRQEQDGGQVPETVDDRLKLPGVGRKSANLIMGDVFGKPAIVTDTHCIRLVNRMGLVEGIKDPKKVEMALWKLIPPKAVSYTHLDVYKRQGLKLAGKEENGEEMDRAAKDQNRQMLKTSWGITDRSSADRVLQELLSSASAENSAYDYSRAMSNLGFYYLADYYTETEALDRALERCV